MNHSEPDENQQLLSAYNVSLQAENLISPGSDGLYYACVWEVVLHGVHHK